MTAAVVAVATVLTALVGLVLYVLKQRDSPTAQRASAQKQVDETKRAWEQARQEMTDELEKANPDMERVRVELEPALLTARRVYDEARLRRDALGR